MLFKLKRPVKSPVGVQATFDTVTMRDLLGEDIVEGFASSDKLSRQIKTMIVRCSNLLPEEIGRLCAADYLALQEHVTNQLNGELPEGSDPKG